MTYNIYIIDDDEVYQYAVSRVLKKQPKAKGVHSFGDGEVAINYLRENIQDVDKLPDLIFLDINMPIMDGWQFLTEYKKLKDDLPKKVQIFMMSSSILDEDIMKARSIPDIKEYVVKPIGSERLKTIMETLD